MVTRSSVGAAPTCLPASSPRIVTGRGGFIDGFANHQRLQDGRQGRGQSPSPRSRGEGAGRRMRGSADLANWSLPTRVTAPLITLLLSLFFLILPAVSARAAMNIQEVTSPKGITAWLVEDYSVPIIAIRFVFDGGSTQDPPGKEGLANLMTGLFDEGAGDLDSEAFQAKLDDAGAEMSFDASRDGTYGTMRMLAEQQGRGVRPVAAGGQQAALRPGADRPYPRPGAVRHHRQRARPRHGRAEPNGGKRYLRRSPLCAARRRHQRKASPRSLRMICVPSTRPISPAAACMWRWSAPSTPQTLKGSSTCCSAICPKSRC